MSADYATVAIQEVRASRDWQVWLVAALAGVFLVSQAYGAPDIYVAADGTGNGGSWAQASSFVSALSTASVNDVIWMEQGTYTNASTFSVSTDGLTIYGGFDGTETLLSERDWTNQLVLLDGENTRCVVNIQADNIVLDGLVVTNGRETLTHAAGLRMNNTGTGLTMLNCSIVENTMPFNGGYGAGAYFNNAGTVLLSNCVIRANLATSRGYGVGFLVQGTTTLTLQGCDIRENHDSGGDQRLGKGFYLKSGTLIMVDTTVVDNYFDSDDNDGRGGGGYIENGTASFTNCVFTSNTVWHSDGGGLYIANGNVTIENCTFAGNGGLNDDGRAEGGAIYQNSGTLTIKNSIFWGNDAGNDGNDGHAIYQNAGTLNISYSCIDGIDLPNVRFIAGTWGDGIITNDPLFAAEYSDVHLKSTVGRWNGSSWVTDSTNSPCIDAGDPASTFSNEPSGENGAWINMGAYGNTWQASKSTNEAPTVVTQAAQVVANAAELRGLLTSGSVSTITFYYGTTDQGETASGWDGTNVLSDGQSVGTVFSSVAGGLLESQAYVFRVYATNAFGDDWSGTNGFTTGTAAPGGGAGVIHVDADAIGVGDGLSWTNAFTTFEDALDAANEGLGTSIWIADGSYPTRSDYVIQTNGLAVYGGFDGTETLLSARDWTNNVVLLNGQGMSRVLDVQADNVLLDGLVITNGYELVSHGAGMRVDGAQDLTMFNSRIVSCTLALNGGRGPGAYFNSAGTVLVSNCVFQANRDTSRGEGCGFWTGGTTLTVRDSELRGNYEPAGDQRNGKGFYLSSGALIMVGCTIADNYGSADSNSGNGIGGFINGGTASFSNCVFTGNGSPSNYGSHGAGLYINGGNITIESCTFANNVGHTTRSEPEGGAIYMNNGTVTIKNSIFWDNQIGNDANDGDTIYQAAGTLNISYSCFDGTELPRVRFLSGTWGDGIITNNPLFATDYTDVHLKSTVGRWNGATWVADSTNSPCIDAGDPTSAYGNEPASANGARINMGAYGNTWQASKSTNEVPTVVTRSVETNATAAELRGEITDGSSSSITFYYGLSDPGETASGWSGTNVLSLPQTPGVVFSSVAGGLQASQTYYFRVYATNDFGDDWSPVATFDTGAAAPGGGAGVIHVDADATGVEEGRSWTNAFTTFEAALAAAEAGQGASIWVAEGTYVPQNTFVIQTNGLSVYGGFAGTETSLSERDWTNNECLLSGGGSVRVLDIQADDTLLDGLVITNGFQNSGNGSGIRMENSGQNLTVLNCSIVGNRHSRDSGYGAGAYFNNAGTVLLSNTVIRANISTIRGMGVGFRSDNTTITVLDCEIRENEDTGGDMRPGKGFYLGSGTLTMVNTVIASNFYGSADSRVAGDGGGGYITGGTASFTNCVFAENDSNRSDGSGLCVNNGNVTIESCTFAGNGTLLNRPQSRGGAIFQNAGTVTIKNSIFWGNAGAAGGDTIYQTSGDIMNISYSCLEGTNSPHLVAGGTINWSGVNITNDPLFAVEYTDVHLKSTAGRWNGSSWVKDAVHSPCIDAGNPTSDDSNELDGDAINMGAYGNTAEASLMYGLSAAGTIFTFY